MSTWLDERCALGRKEKRACTLYTPMRAHAYVDLGLFIHTASKQRARKIVPAFAAGNILQLFKQKARVTKQGHVTS